MFFGGGVDWSRPVLLVLPAASLASALITGATGVGGAMILTAAWQLSWILFRVPETDSLELLALVIAVQQLQTVASFAYHDWRVWQEYGWVGIFYALTVMVCSPLGALCRETLDPELVSHAIMWVMLLFVLFKIPLPRCRCRTASCPECRKGTSQSDEIEKDLEDARVAALPAPATAASAEGSKGTSQVDIAPASASTRSRQEAVGSEELQASDGKPGSKEVDEPGFDMRSIRWPLLLSAVFTGILGGICGLVGPPYIVMVSLYSVPSALARPLIPYAMFLELPVRTTLLIRRVGLSTVVADTHIIALSFLVNQFGLVLGHKMAAKVSQRMFEVILLAVLGFSCYLALGLLDLSQQSLTAVGCSVLLAAGRIACCLLRRRSGGQQEKPSSSRNTA